MPMILMGDEVRRTQRGNNNAYCQDNEISWFDWTLLEQARRRPPLRQDAHRDSDAPASAGRAARPDPERASAPPAVHVARRPVECTRPGSAVPHAGGYRRLPGYPVMLHLIVNACWEALEFELPVLGRPERLATLPRYLARCSGRRLWLARCPGRAGANLSGSPSLRGGARCENRGFQLRYRLSR